MTYIAAELEPVTAHPDVNGKLHLTREDAIEANFNQDLQDAVCAHCIAENLGQMPALLSVKLIRTFVKEHEDMVRILLGDRDFT